MNAIQIVQALGPIDIRSVRRDSLLRGIIAVPILMVAGVRWLIPFLGERISMLTGFDITAYYPLLASLLIMILPLLFGAVIGFLLLDERDARTLLALQVTPLALRGYLAYRITMPVIISILLAITILPLTGLVSLGFGALLVVSIVAAPFAPLLAVALAVLAENKVQGFAIMKGNGVILLPPLIAYFVHGPWQLLFGLAPTYWPVKVFWAFQESDPLVWVYATVGLTYQALLLWLLLRCFDKVAKE